ncbi:MAG TPA: hypothetical protein VIS07_22755 [Candidatus Binatia bacterium]
MNLTTKLKTATAILVLAVSVGSVAVGTAHGATDREKHQQRGAKFAVPPGSTKLRAMCICKDGSSRHGALGNLRQFLHNDLVYVSCSVPTFTAAGQTNGSYACSTFEPLVK